MKKRNPIAVFCFSFITIFIYSWYWQVKTKGEMNKLGEKIPTAFIWLIPIVGSIWWTWKYSEGVEHVTQKELSSVLAFIVLWLLGPIGYAIVQDYFNKIQPVMAGVPASPIAGQPTSFVPSPQPTATPTFVSSQANVVTPAAVPAPPTQQYSDSNPQEPSTTATTPQDPSIESQQPPTPPPAAPLIGG